MQNRPKVLHIRDELKIEKLRKFYGHFESNRVKALLSIETLLSKN